jgi:hypothetical protein
MTRDSDLPLIWGEQAEHNLDQRALARAVCTQQSRASRRHAQRNVM